MIAVFSSFTFSLSTHTTLPFKYLRHSIFSSSFHLTRVERRIHDWMACHKSSKETSWLREKNIRPERRWRSKHELSTDVNEYNFILKKIFLPYFCSSHAIHHSRLLYTTNICWIRKFLSLSRCCCCYHFILFPSPPYSPKKSINKMAKRRLKNR